MREWGGTLRVPLSARAGVIRSLTIAGAAIWLSIAPSRVAEAQPTVPAGTIHSVALPGGVEGIRRAIGDRRTTSPATVVIDMTRRFHGGTSDAAGGDPVLAQLRRWLRACLRDDDCRAPELAADRVPLPGSPALWRDVVFERRVPEARLVPAILERRDAALLYTALLSMREDVRAWMLARPALIRQLRGVDAGPLVIAAPYLRLEDGRWMLPGGPSAMPVWTALVGAPSEAPEPWLLALLRADGGLLAYLAELVATLSPEQQQSVLRLADPDPARRIDAGVELVHGVRGATHGWDLRARPFWRPSIDPAFLLGQMRAGGAGRLALPGGRAFWALVFRDGPVVPRPTAVRAAWNDPTPVSAGWLLPQIWLVAPVEQALRYEQVLFASRRLAGVDAEQAGAAATVVRGYGRYPQLLRLLDRLDIDDVGLLAGLVARAEALSAASRDWRGHAAAVRWQCALVFLDTMARLGALERDELLRALDVLAAVDVVRSSPPSRGTHVRALLAGLGVGAVAGDLPARPVEDALVARLTRSRIGEGRRVTWEDQVYRLDVGAAERDRIARVRGRDAQPRLDAAWAVYRLSASGCPARGRGGARPARTRGLGGPPRSGPGHRRVARCRGPRRGGRGPPAGRARPCAGRLGRDPRCARRPRRRARHRGARRDGLRRQPGLGRRSAAQRPRGLAPARLHQAVAGRGDRRVVAAPRDRDVERQRLARGRQPAGPGRRAGAGRVAAAVIETAVPPRRH